jgi:hypothetical protein
MKLNNFYSHSSRRRWSSWETHDKMKVNLISTIKFSLISTIKFSSISIVKLSLISTIRFNSISIVKLNLISTIRFSLISRIRFSLILTIRLNSISTIILSSISTIRLNSISTIRLSSILLIRLSSISTIRLSLILAIKLDLILTIRFSSISTNRNRLETNANDKIQMRKMIAIVENQIIYENEIYKNMMIIFTMKKIFCFYCFRLFTLSELYVMFINRYWKKSSNWSNMILVESSRYVWIVFKMLVETLQNLDRVILNDFSKIEKERKKWINNYLNFFVFLIR